MTQYCSRHSREAGEPLAGTGAHARSNLLLSWPIGRWTRTYHQARDMTEAVSSAVAGLVGAGRRVNLIHRADQPADRHRVYLMPEQQAFEVPREDLAEFLSAVSRGESLLPWAPVEVRHKVVLCCTHGVKDKCCAKFGNATFKALDRAARERGDAMVVWQSTHLGGCRLASAALVFPALRKYGRIEDRHIHPWLDSEGADRPYLPCYRGDGALTPIRQVAEVEARRRLRERGLWPSGVRVLAERHEEAGYADLEVAWEAGDQRGRYSIRLRALPVRRFGTCVDLDEGGAPDEVIAWTPVTAGPVTVFDPDAHRSTRDVTA